MSKSLSEIMPSCRYPFGLVNQQLHKYYKAFGSLMLRSIQAAMGGNSRNNLPLTKGTGPWPAMGIATGHLLSR
jgi:hypothetical protein